ncbi:MAG: hypothetical protein WBB28_18960 [Crinalium sp.]
MKTKQQNTGQVVKAKHSNTVGHTGFQACGEKIRLLGACIKSIS